MSSCGVKSWILKQLKHVSSAAGVLECSEARAASVSELLTSRDDGRCHILSCCCVTCSTARVFDAGLEPPRDPPGVASSCSVTERCGVAGAAVAAGGGAKPACKHVTCYIFYHISDTVLEGPTQHVVNMTPFTKHAQCHVASKLRAQLPQHYHSHRLSLE